MVVAEKDLQRQYYYREQQEIYRRSKTKQQTKPKQRSTYKIVNIVRLVIIALLAFLLLSRYAFLSESQYRLNNLQSEIQNIEFQNERLRVEIAKLKSVARIEDIAKNKLNMKEPGNQQIIFYNTD
ncbi:MAG TPA: cell division protein FtsL [Thermoanaerobacterales bacterium]|nr:cell division protein FtsL [Thermoanaerobacterales bacterium]